MWLKKLILAFLPILHITKAAYVCTDIDFCRDLRNRTPEDKYQVNLDSISSDVDSALVQFELSPNDGSDPLLVIVTALEDKTFRIQISELDSQRYALVDVLDDEPKISQNVEVVQGIEDLVVTSGESSAKITFSSFKIEISLNGNLQVVFDGSQLNYDKSLDQAFTFGVLYPQAIQLYGLAEHCDILTLRTTKNSDWDPYRLKNRETGGYTVLTNIALQGSIPVLYGHGPASTSGVFSHNAAENWVEITNGVDATNSYFMVESGMLDLFVFLGPTPTEVVRQYVALTGTAHLPQLWALGYHQSRYTYKSQDDLKEVVANFGNYDFPLDVMWLDIDYTDGMRYFTWNPETFSDPLEMQQNISVVHKRLVTIIDPHIKVDPNYNVYAGGIEKDIFVKNPDGSNFENDCWPGLSTWTDFLNPEGRDYIADFYSYDKFPGSTPVLAGIWNDMNEPSVFDSSSEDTFPKDLIQFGGVLNRDVHNIYGFLQAKSTHQGLLQRDNGEKRPFILSRSHFAGTQRYAAIWTGDNNAKWEDLKISYSMCLNSNMLGLVFCGADIGGFNQSPGEELVQRWYQAATWLPFYRGHSNGNTIRREPYLWSEEAQIVIRDAMELRYRHIPVFYTLFYEHTRNKDPIIRPLFYQYPEDEQVYGIDDQLLVGSDIMAKVVAEEGAQSVQVYFPGGDDELWFSVHGDGEIHGGEGLVDIPVTIAESPVYYRGGSIIATKASRLSTDEMLSDGYILYVNPDKEGKATGTVYLDDYTSFDYIDRKRYNYLRLDLNGIDIAITPIDDDADSADFEFKIDQIIVNDITKLPTQGQTGKYERKVFDKTSKGQLLKNLSFKKVSKVSLK